MSIYDIGTYKDELSASISQGVLVSVLWAVSSGCVMRRMRGCVREGVRYL